MIELDKNKRQTITRIAGMLIALAAMAGCANRSEPAENVIESIIQELPPVSEATWRGTGTLECRPETKDMCGPGGCSRQPASVWLRWTPATRTYQRCDRNGCDSYTANVTYSGSYAVVEIPGHQTIMKLTGRNAFLEIVSQMDGVIIYRGQCRPAPNP